MDWKEAKAQLDELAGQAREQKNEVGLLVSDSIGAIAEQLGRLHQSVSHVAERLDALTSQLAELEERVHEDVE